MAIADIQRQTFFREESTHYFQNALSIIGNSQYVPENFYSVVITRPNKPSYRNLMYLCDGAELPGRILTTTTQRFYGPTQKYPTISSYNDLTLSFICLADNKMYPKWEFESWIDEINPTENWNLKYKDEYISDIKISQYIKTGEKIYEAILKDAFPIAIYPQQLNFASPNHHSLKVTFAYNYFNFYPVNVDLTRESLTSVVEEYNRYIREGLFEPSTEELLNSKFGLTMQDVNNFKDSSQFLSNIYVSMKSNINEIGFVGAGDVGVLGSNIKYI
jgi:hypothetical protein